MITVDDIRYAYRLFLNRDGSDDEIFEKYHSSIPSIMSLRDQFLASPEYIAANQSAGLAASARDYLAAPRQVEVMVRDEADLKRLTDRVAHQWRSLGDAEPYWSVLTAEEFRSANLRDSSLQRFYATGQASADLLDAFAARVHVKVPNGVCFELGCGVGRITAFLAAKFEHVIAADISPGNLALCRDYMEKHGIGNVTTILLDNPSKISDMPKFDFFYSLIVLQHNPPPIQNILLSQCLANINPDGLAFFQTPDNYL